MTASPETPTNNPAPSRSEWVELRDDFAVRLTFPFRSPTFILYFFIVMILIGGLGIWIPIFAHLGLTTTAAGSSQPLQTSTATAVSGGSSLPSQIASYLMAVIAAAFVDVMLDGRGRRSFRMAAFSVLTFAIMLGAVALGTDSEPGSWPVLRCARSGASLFLWAYPATRKNKPLMSRSSPLDSFHRRRSSAASLSGDLDGITA